MRVFNEEEAQVRAWKLKLRNTNTNRQSLKNDLLTILNDDSKKAYVRLSQFNLTRNDLLSKDKHQQGWSWISHFNWLNWLFSFFPASWNLPKWGSQLRENLSRTPVPEQHELLTLTDYQHDASFRLLDDNEFENALFDEPMSALSDLKVRLERLKQNHHTQTEIKELINRLYSLKYRLEPSLYQNLLEKLYQTHPKLTSQVFYSMYKKEHYLTPSNQDFVELHMLTRTLIDHFVLRIIDFPVRNDSILYLLTLLTISNPMNKTNHESGLLRSSQNPKTMMTKELQRVLQNKPAYVLFNSELFYVNHHFKVTELKLNTKLNSSDRNLLLSLFPNEENHLANASRKNLKTITSLTGHPWDQHDYILDLFNVWDEPNALYKTYDQLQNHLVKNNWAKLPEIKKSARRSHHALMRPNDDKEGTSSRQTLFSMIDFGHLQHLIDYNLLNPHSSHPLLGHAAHQCLEQLFVDYWHNLSDDTWLPGHLGYESIQFISNHVIKATKHITQMPTNLSDQCEPCLNPRLVQTIPPSMKHAETLAISLIKALSQGILLSQARSLRTQFGDAPSLSNKDLEWILSRVQHVDNSLMKKLRHCLADTKVYNMSDLGHLIESSSSNPGRNAPLDQLITCIRDNLNTAKLAMDQCDSATENHVMEQVLVAFHHCLHHDQLDSKTISILHNELLPLLRGHYVVDSVATQWETELREHHGRLVSWDVSKLQISFEDNQNPLVQANDHLEAALSNKYKAFNRDFENEYVESQLAVYYFHQYLLIQTPGKNNLAIMILENLKGYLTSDQYKQWKKIVHSNLSTHLKVVSSPSFFDLANPEEQALPVNLATSTLLI
jgi:hypothetical protein